MSSTTITMRKDPTKLAWQVLATSFGIFVALVFAALYASYWFLFQSRVPLSVDVSASRGTASINLPNTGDPIAVANSRANLENGVAIVTDSTSQAIVQFYESNNSREPIGSLIVYRDSQVVLHEMSKPRFALNTDPYQIRAELINGKIEFEYFEDRRRDSRLVTESAFGTVSTREPGDYVVEVSRNSLQLLVNDGQARIWRPESTTFVRVRSQEMVAISGEEAIIQVVDAPASLLESPTVAEDFEDGWLFYNDREPPGSAEHTEFQGRPVVVIDRSTEKYPDTVIDHGETGLVQNMDVDVSGHTFLAMTATFFVEEQSLSTCGSLGSECPMMVRFSYMDEEGNEQIFIHGFYAEHDPGLGFPLACASCQSEHERINANTWYTYDSGNLLTAWPRERLPQQITQVSFYASGHAYKIYVAELDLLADE